MAYSVFRPEQRQMNSKETSGFYSQVFLGQTFSLQGLNVENVKKCMAYFNIME